VTLENREERTEPAPKDVGRKCPMTHLERAYFDRQADLIDAYSLKMITRDEFIRGLNEMNLDYYEAKWMADQIEAA
jgi:hypothetical protein